MPGQSLHLVYQRAPVSIRFPNGWESLLMPKHCLFLRCYYIFHRKVPFQWNHLSSHPQMCQWGWYSTEGLQMVLTNCLRASVNLRLLALNGTKEADGLPPSPSLNLLIILAPKNSEDEKLDQALLQFVCPWSCRKTMNPASLKCYCVRI